MFEFLSSKFEELFYKIRGKGRITERDLDEALRDIKLALLEADVNFKVVKLFLENIRQKAKGSNILENLSPFQQIVKIVNEELVNLLGSSGGKISFANRIPTIIMLMGLQGSGKTTCVAKLAKFIKERYGKTVCIVASDVYRPAAVLQISNLVREYDIEVYSDENSDPVTISARGVEKFTRQGCEVIIIDTAGRLHIDEAMMDELINIKKAIKPHQVFLVLDGMTGQEAVNIASSFNSSVEYDGIILTKLDSDARGGAALSIYYTIRKPINFVSTGEKVEDFDLFYPDRMASRILGMGDILTFIEKSEKAIDQEKAKKLEEKLSKNELDLEDFLEQIRGIRKMGSLNKVFSMLPMMGKSKLLKDINLDDRQLVRVDAIISSMTRQERRNPAIINGSRKKRIARGSGTSVVEVNRLLKQFEETKKLLKQLSGFQDSFQGVSHFPFTRTR
ncbi:MAG: signal recognition particle protein [Actinobacteria bacterium]|nr:signal recognition particle protein [Actinomycetota bacterium]